MGWVEHIRTSVSLREALGLAVAREEEEEVDDEDGDEDEPMEEDESDEETNSTSTFVVGQRLLASASRTTSSQLR